MRTSILLSLLLATAVPFATAHGAESDFSGSVEMQVRTFWHDPAWVGQDATALLGSGASVLEFRWRNNDDNQRISVIPYLRWDASDRQRSLADLREAYWAIESDDYELLIGSNTLFWGVTESAHLVDIVNQTDLAGDIDGEEKLGQPMINVTRQAGWGEIGVFVLPWFRDRTFAGVDGHFRPPLVVDADDSMYESSSENGHVDFALRYSHYIGDVDIGLSAFRGTSREPRFVPASDKQALLPVYDQIRQYGVDLQYTSGAWLWKLEGIARRSATHSFAAAVGGLEYTTYQVGGSIADVGWLLEYQYDGRNESEPLTIADNDLFLGARLAFNDIQDTAILAGIAYDVRTGEAFINIEAERRFGEDWSGELRLRTFSGADAGESTFWLQDDDYLQLSISRYF